MDASAPVGRHRELAAAAAFLGRCTSGPHGLRVYGDAGIGKTTVCRAVVELAHERAMRVLAATPSQYETSASFSVLTDLMSTVSDGQMRALPGPQSRALLAAVLREEAPDPIEPRAVAAAVRSLLAAMAQRESVLVVIDDEQWADDESVAALNHALRRLPGVPVGLLLTRRSSTPPRLSLDLLDAFDAGTSDQIELPGLDGAAIDAVLDRHATAAADPHERRRIHRLASGNPFFAVELARAANSDGRAGELPGSLRALVEARAGHLPLRTREVLLVAAVVANPTVSQIAQGAGRSTARTLNDLERGVDGDLIRIDRRTGVVRFTHPLFPEAIHALASARERRAAHRRVAPAVRDPEARALHLAAATVGTDRELAGLLEATARTARARGASASAVEIIEQAIRLTPLDDCRLRQRRQVLQAELLFHGGDVATSRDMLQAVLGSTTSTDVRAAALRTLAVLLLHQDSFAVARALLTDLVALSREDPTARVDAWLHMAYAAVSMGDFADAARYAIQAVEEAEGIDDRGLLAQALAVAEICAFTQGLGVDDVRLGRALELEDPSRSSAMEMRPSFIAGCIRTYQGRLDEALGHLWHARTTALERGEEATAATVGGYLAWAWCWLGDLPRAREAIDDALTLARRSASRSEECLALAYSSVISAYEGRIDRARVESRESVRLADETGYAIAPLWARWGLAVAELQGDEPRAAADAVEPFLALVEERGLPEPVRVVCLSDGIEGLIHRGTLDRARTLADVLAEAAERHDRPWARMLAQRNLSQVAAARGDLVAAQQHIDDALTVAETVELRVEAARTRLVAGRLARRRRRRGHAAVLLDAAVREFDSAGAAGWADLARLEAARASSRRVDGAQLTETQRRVADLTASGLTNREVATRLCISAKTVEANLAHVYAKLGIRSRAELGARLGRRRDGETPDSRRSASS